MTRFANHIRLKPPDAGAKRRLIRDLFSTKRIQLFLRLNGFEIHASQKDTYRFLIEVASGNISAREVNNWVAINLTEIRAE